MIERLIYAALKSGIAELVANPTRFTRIFEDYYGLGTTETAEIRKYF